MQAVESKPLFQAALGMDILSPETALPEGAVRDVLNMDVNGAGHARTRIGARRLSTLFGAHSLWSPTSGAFGLYAHDDALKRLAVEGTSLNATTLLTGLKRTGRMAYFEHAGEVFFTNGHDLGVVTASGARPLGIPGPDVAPDLQATEGGMPAGHYCVALSYVSPTGEESAVSPASFIAAPLGGVSVALPVDIPADIVSVRVYATMANGEVLYLASEVPVGFASVSILSEDRTKEAEALRFRTRMPGGADVCVYNGRVYVSRGRQLIFSEPFRYGLTDPRHNFITFQGEILFHQPVSDGIYVGTRAGTYFLGGATPKDASQVLVGPAPVGSHCIRVASGDVGGTGQSLLALWLGTKGFTLGAPGGAVSTPQGDRIALPDQGAARISSIFAGGVHRVVAVVPETRTDLQAAPDSFI